MYEGNQVRDEVWLKGMVGVFMIIYCVMYIWIYFVMYKGF